jgi:membrane-bound serine protease (ClpP class)
MLGGGEAQDPELAKKIVNDTAAFARAIAERRARNLEWVESAVRDSKSATASEALEKDVIDRVAGSRRELLSAVDGTEVVVGAAPVRLSVRDAVVQELSMTVQERILAALGNPSVAYLLLLAGLFALTFEVYAPGTFVFGGIGVLCLLLAAIGLGMLPVSAGGVVFIVLAVALFAAELFVTSHGLLTLAGVCAFIAGSALLFDRSDADFFADASVRLSWGLVLPLAITLGAGAALLAFHGAKSQRRAQVTGREALAGAPGVALTDIDTHGGSAWVHGERWNAASDVRIARGQTVCVKESSGLTLRVAPQEPKGQTRPSPEEPT